MFKDWGTAWRATLCALLTASCGDSAEFTATEIEKEQDININVASEDAEEADVIDRGAIGDLGDPGEKKEPDKPVEPPAIVDIEIPLQTYDRLIWHWECVANGDIELFPASDTEAVVQGAGPHSFDPAELPATDVVLTGTICTPEQQARDLVFLIDVSGSMSTNDPMVNGSCGRLDSIRAVVDGLPTDGTTMIGLLTFADSVPVTSSHLVRTLAELEADVAPGGNFAALVCAQAGGTNYSAGMTRASELLAMGREDATKEVYFVSDGQPNSGQNGVAEADALRQPGVLIGNRHISATIATVMLGGVDSVLEEFIASKDANGNPLHAFADDADGLAEVLSELSENELVRADLMYRPVGTRGWTQVDILQYMLDYSYQLPEITLSKDSAPGGFEIVYFYQDRHGNVTTDHGKIKWRNVPRETCKAIEGTEECLGEGLEK